MSVAAPSSAPHTPTLLQLFLAFITVSLSGFGGVLAWSQRVLVEERRWMTQDEFNDAYALCQFLPGPNIVNLSVVFGSKVRGPAGAVVALIGLLGPPFVIVTLVGLLYSYYGELEIFRRMLAGLSAAAAGLIIAVTAKMAKPLFGPRLGAAPFIALAAFLGVGVLRWPLPAVLAVLVPLSIAIAWWTRPR
jgi:chromate transporter